MGSMSLFLASCKKGNDTLPAVETYKLVGRIDPTRTTISTAVLTKAEFTVSFNNANSFGDAQSIVNGTLTLSGFSFPIDTITTKIPIANTSPADTTVNRTFYSSTLDFLASQSSGVNISYITIPTSKSVSYKTSVLPYPTSSGLFGNYGTLYYNFNNSASASFTITNFPFINELTSALKEGKGYFRIGRAPNYVYILLDAVTKL